MTMRMPLGKPSPANEQQADAMAQQVMASSIAPLASTHLKPAVPGGDGEPLTPAIRQFMEPRFGRDFSQVRVHASAQSEAACSRLHAQAFAWQNHIHFGKGHAAGVNELTAHELTHVVQHQTGQAMGPACKLEVRSPGPGVASALGRKQELLKRLNEVSPGVIQYEFKGNRIVPTVLKEDALSYFDRTMLNVCNGGETIPLLLAEDKPGNQFNVPGIAAPLVGLRITGDIFVNGVVDLDDLVKISDIHAFESIFLHILAERQSVGKHSAGRNYNTQLAAGTLYPVEKRAPPGGKGRYDRIHHEEGHQAQAKHLQDILGDDSIVYSSEKRFVAGKAVSQLFHSQKEGYFVYLEINDRNRVTRARFKVLTADKRRISLDDFLAERNAIPAPFF